MEKESGSALVGRSKEEARQTVTIQFGAFAPKLSEQAVAAYLLPEELSKFELIADAITVVTVHGYMSGSQSDKARDRLAKKIVSTIKSAGAQ